MPRLSHALSQRLPNPTRLHQRLFDARQVIKEDNVSLLQSLDTAFIVFIFDDKGCIRYANNQASKTSGHPTSFFVGKRFNILESKHPTKTKFAEIVAGIKKNGHWRNDVLEWRSDGEYYWVDVTVAPFKTNDSEANSYIAIKQIITERKKTEEDLLAANAELESFNYTISHDLRTPLRAMEIFAEMLMRETYDKTVKNLVSKILTSTTEMKGMISKMLELSRIGWKSMDKTKVDMKAMAEQVFEVERMMHNQKSVHLQIDNIPSVHADKVLIKAIWMNLISNAIKYSSKQTDTLIKISAKVKDKYIEYCVQDNGAGFDMNLYDKLFKTFSRLHSVREFSGLGAGLAIVEKIARVHGGSVRAVSSGKGATFYFSLPL